MNAEKAHQRETTGSSNDSLQLLPFSKWELLLKGKNLLPEGVNSFLYKQFPIVWKITFIKSSFTIFITHVRNLRQWKIMKLHYGNQKFAKEQSALRLNTVCNKNELCCAHTGPDHHWSVVNAV